VRTPGRIALYDSCSFRRFGTEGEYCETVYASRHRDGQLSIEARNRDDMQHIVDCWNAIDAIGGDPATVQELVAALRNVTGARHYHVGPEYTCATCGHDLRNAVHYRSDESQRSDLEAARAVLAKIPEAK